MKVGELVCWREVFHDDTDMLGIGIVVEDELFDCMMVLWNDGEIDEVNADDLVLIHEEA